MPNTYSSGQTITAAIVNANFSDVGTELTNSVARDGQTTMTGPIKAANGSAAAPSITFGSDTDTGLYRKSADTIGVSIGGTEVAEISSKGSTFVPPGVMMPYVGTTSPTGWVRANGRTIGNASSGASERANADTEALFALLWNSYSDSVCAVSSGRGASAAADYAANKTIGLPDLRGRSFFGLDDMGNSAASRLGSIITSQTTNGASGGTETVTLSTAQLPSHTHDLSNHTHSVSGTSGSETADHTHNWAGTTSTTGAHTHTVSIANALGGGGTQTWSIAGTGSTAPISTSTGGDHAHTYSGTTSGMSNAHQHAFSATSAGPSNNTSGAAGSGGAHSNMPPAFLTTYIIKL